MKRISIAAFAVLLAAAPFSFAADPAQHDEHHPDAPAAKMLPNNAAETPSASGKIGKMDAQMNAMCEMHEKMMAAKTPDERSALMSDQMKMMRDGMSMMDDKGADTRPMSPKMMQKKMRMMQKQMDMMQAMMQMMMDHMTDHHKSMQDMGK